MAAAATASVAGCNARGRPTTSTAGRDAGDPAPTDRSGDATYGFTFLRATGNRYLRGTGRVPDVDPVDVSLPAPPEWVVAAPDRSDGTTVWATALADGRVRAHRLDGREVTQIEPFPSYGEGPPLLVIDAGHARILSVGALHTHSTPIPGGSATVRTDGGLAIPGGELDPDPIGDARVVTDGELVYLLGQATTYRHGALGDEVEGGAVAVVDPRTRDIRMIEPPYGVIEGLWPILTTLGGAPSMLVTASDAEQGASLALLRDDGSDGGRVVATSDPVGEPYGWRHQIAVAPFGPGGEREVASVRKPHVGATAQFHRLDGDDLVPVASLEGYPSHEFGSRNLDRAAAGDFDGDGQPELVVPTTETGVLAALRRTDGGVEEAWRLRIGGELTSNVTAARGRFGVEFAAGTPAGLRLWPAAQQT